MAESGAGDTKTQVSLAALGADWNQTGAYSIVLNNTAAGLKILEAGATPSLYGIFDVADLNSADKTYTFPDASGIVITTGNLASITATGTVGTGTWNADPIAAGKGGTGIDTSAATGVAQIASGTWSVSGTTGTGNIVRASSPTITTPTISGDITYSGAQPKRTAILTAAGAIVAPAAGFADQVRTDGTNFSYYTLNFDQTAQEKAYWQFVVPSSYTGATVDVTIYWTSAETAGDAVWRVATDSKAAGAAWDAVLSAPSTAPPATTSGTANAVNTTTITGVTSGWALDEPVVFELIRVAADGSDTLAADAKVLQVKIEWTSATESD